MATAAASAVSKPFLELSPVRDTVSQPPPVFTHALQAMAAIHTWAIQPQSVQQQCASKGLTSGETVTGNVLAQDANWSVHIVHSVYTLCVHIHIIPAVPIANAAGANRLRAGAVPVT